MQLTELQEISFAEEENTQRVYVDFRIRGNALDPASVSKWLNLEPSRSWAKGDNYTGKMRNPKTNEIVTTSRKRLWGLWVSSSNNMVISKRVEDHMVYLLSKLEQKQQKLSRYLDSPEVYTVSFYVHWEPRLEYGSFELSGKIMARLGALCHHTEFAWLQA
ncbi:MAG TPA: DUF4279 domain-containing protein [Caldilineaceae bacterium]|nr:DUF4279 domain-containing protein [Caldilineaceae bacterium]